VKGIMGVQSNAQLSDLIVAEIVKFLQSGRLKVVVSPQTYSYPPPSVTIKTQLTLDGFPIPGIYVGF
jgi:hypothetical protein